MDPNWLLGFFEGEGNFSFSIVNHKRNHSYKHYGIPFLPIFKCSIAQVEKKPLLNVQSFLQKHLITSHVKEHRDKNGYLLCCSLLITDSADLLKFIILVDKLQWHTNKKYNQYKTFKRSLFRYVTTFNILYKLRLCHKKIMKHGFEITKEELSNLYDVFSYIYEEKETLKLARDSRGRPRKYPININDLKFFIEQVIHINKL